jgi:pyruvate dehydrogenase E1 component beta subunit
VIFVEHRLLYDTEAPVPESAIAVPFGKARVCRKGDDLTIVGISAMLPECLGAAELLAKAGVEAEVIDPISLSPLDIETIAHSVERTRRLLVVDTAWTMCGASAEIVAAIAERLGSSGGLSLQRMGHAPATCPTSPWLESAYYPDMRKIAARGFAMARPTAPEWVPPPDSGAMTRKPFRGPF